MHAQMRNTEEKKLREDNSCRAELFPWNEPKPLCLGQAESSQWSDHKRQNKQGLVHTAHCLDGRIPAALQLLRHGSPTARQATLNVSPGEWCKAYCWPCRKQGGFHVEDFCKESAGPLLLAGCQSQAATRTRNQHGTLLKPKIHLSKAKFILGLTLPIWGFV